MISCRRRRVQISFLDICGRTKAYPPPPRRKRPSGPGTDTAAAGRDEAKTRFSHSLPAATIRASSSHDSQTASSYPPSTLGALQKHHYHGAPFTLWGCYTSSHLNKLDTPNITPTDYTIRAGRRNSTSLADLTIREEQSWSCMPSLTPSPVKISALTMS